jgi:hypothetical protein
VRGVTLRQLHAHWVEGKSSKNSKGQAGTAVVDLCIAAGEVDLAQNVLTRLLIESENIQRAELLRLEGALFLHCTSPDANAAERRFREAIQVARDQRAKSFELRAATSLAEL